MDDGNSEDDLDDDDDEDDMDVAKGEELSVFVRKSKGKKKKAKAGRQSAWKAEEVDDFIDIVVSSSYYKKKLIFTNTKNQRNGEIYQNILKEMKERASARGDVFQFDVKQMRTKFKKCVSDCKQAALTIKTATGIKRFQENRGLGQWFKTLFAVVKTRDSCQPDQAVEPPFRGKSPSSEQSSTSEKSPSLDQPSTTENSPSSDRSFQNDDNIDEGELFVPIKKSKKQKPREKLDAAVAEVVEVVKQAVTTDPTKDLIRFMREEMDKSREHELKLFQLLTKSNVGFDSHQQHAFQVVHQPGSIPYAEGGALASGNNQAWYGGSLPYLQRPPMQSMTSTSTVNYSDGNTYQNL